MKAVEGIYDGKRIKPLEPLHMPANVRVIITFLDTPQPTLRRTRIEDVAGCLAYRGPAKSLADMDKAIDQDFVRDAATLGRCRVTEPQ